MHYAGQVLWNNSYISISDNDSDELYNHKVDQQKNGNDFEQKCLKFWGFNASCLRERTVSWISLGFGMLVESSAKSIDFRITVYHPSHLQSLGVNMDFFYLCCCRLCRLWFSCSDCATFQFPVPEHLKINKRSVWIASLNILCASIYRRMTKNNANRQHVSF